MHFRGGKHKPADLKGGRPTSKSGPRVPKGASGRPTKKRSTRRTK